MQILTDLSISQNKMWNDAVDQIAFNKSFFGKGQTYGIFRTYLYHLIYSLYILYKSRNYDVTILRMSTAALIFSFMNKLRSGPSKLITVGSYIQKPNSNMIYLIKRHLLKRIETKIVFTRKEISNYSTYFNIDKNKYRYIPFSHTLEGYDYEIDDHGYIFCGGNGYRDYKVFIQAIRGIECRAIIPSLDPSIFNHMELPENVEIVNVSHSEYRQLMAHSMITVVPIKSGLLIGGGIQTYLNAMAMGKPVIVTNVPGAEDYIENRLTGIIVPADDPVEMKRAILDLINNKDYANQLGQAAKNIVIHRYTLSNYVKRLLDIANEIYNN